MDRSISTGTTNISGNAKVHFGHHIVQGTEPEQQVLRWLARNDDAWIAAQWRKHAESRLKYSGDTLQWFFDRPKYQNWLKNDKERLLWCPGQAGAGKTILASHIVENLADHPSSSSREPLIAFFYCMYLEKSELELILGFLLQQLRKAETNDVFLIIDGLDELSLETRDELIFVLRDIASRILITSRDLPDIEECIGPCVKVEVRASESDMTTHIRRTFGSPSGRAFRRLILRHSAEADFCNSVQKEIETTLSRRADGMFLLTELQLKATMRSRTIQAVRESLASTPKTLDEFYDASWRRITNNADDRDASYGRAILMWISNVTWYMTKVSPSLRLHYVSVNSMAMTVEALRQVLAISMEHVAPDTMPSEDQMLRLEDIIDLGAGLLACVDESSCQKFGFIHFSAADYFKRRRKELDVDGPSTTTATFLHCLQVAFPVEQDLPKGRRAALAFQASVEKVIGPVAMLCHFSALYFAEGASFGARLSLIRYVMDKRCLNFLTHGLRDKIIGEVGTHAWSSASKRSQMKILLAIQYDLPSLVQEALVAIDDADLLALPFLRALQSRRVEIIQMLINHGAPCLQRASIETDLFSPEVLQRISGPIVALWHEAVSPLALALLTRQDDIVEAMGLNDADLAKGRTEVEVLRESFAEHERLDSDYNSVRMSKEGTDTERQERNFRSFLEQQIAGHVKLHTKTFVGEEHRPMSF